MDSAGLRVGPRHATVVAYRHRLMPGQIRGMAAALIAGFLFICVLIYPDRIGLPRPGWGASDA